MLGTILCVEPAPRNAGDVRKAVTEWWWKPCLRHPAQVHSDAIMAQRNLWSPRA
jgi:hypothetical protein